MVWVYFDVLEGDAFFEEEEKYALGEGTELAGEVSECESGNGNGGRHTHPA